MAACENVIDAGTAAMFLGGGGGTLIAYSNDVTISINHDLRETTNKDSAGWRNYMPGLRGWESSVTGWFATDDSAVETLLNTNIITNRDKVTVAIKQHSSPPSDIDSNATGLMNATLQGDAYVENVTLNFNGSGTNADFSASVRGCSSLTYSQT